jgi:DNA-binding GntR family transcriptional regulator
VLFLGHGIVNPTAAQLLRLPAAAPLVHVRRLRFAARTPVAVMENWLPGEFAWLTETELAGDGLYSVLRSHSRGPDAARQRIGAKAAGSADAVLLKVRRGTPLLTMESLGYDADGIPVECGTHVYRADVYSIEVLVHADPSSNAGS